MTRYAWPSGSWPKSVTPTTPGSLTRAAAWPSRTKRADIAGSEAIDGLRSFTATGGPWPPRRARYTIPIAPRPSSLSITYGPMRTGIVASAAGATRGGGSAGAASRRTSREGPDGPGVSPTANSARVPPTRTGSSPSATVASHGSRPASRARRTTRARRDPRAHVERDRALPEDEPHLGVAVIRPPASRARRSRRRGRARRAGRLRGRRRSAGRSRPPRGENRPGEAGRSGTAPEV